MPIFQRFTLAFLTIPRTKDWAQAVGLLLIFSLLYVPIGFALGFLTIDARSSLQTMMGVIAGTFLMPALLEESIFRVLLLPHPTEALSTSKRWLFSILSWLGFIAYHLHPFTPIFFSEPAFLIGAGAIGIICTIAYLKSGSAWVPITLHWLVVVAWLLFFGGLKKFQT